MPNLNAVRTLRGHTDRIGGAAWHPAATRGLGEGAANIATGGGEGDVKLWSLDGCLLSHPLPDKVLLTVTGRNPSRRSRDIAAVLGGSVSIPREPSSARQVSTGHGGCGTSRRGKSCSCKKVIARRSTR